MAIYKIIYQKPLDADKYGRFLMLLKAADPKTAFQQASMSLGIKIPGDSSTSIITMNEIPTDSESKYYRIDFIYNEMPQFLVEHAVDFFDAYDQAMTQLNTLPETTDKGIININYFI